MYSQDTLSRVKKAYEEGSIEALKEKSERKANIKNRVPEDVEQAVVERVFEDAKSECGMADYQVRKWKAWHHHMALVMMAMQFMLTERIYHKETFPLLSCAHIEEPLSRFLPRREVTEEEILHQLEHRYRQRQMAIESHTRRKNPCSDITS